MLRTSLLSGIAFVVSVVVATGDAVATPAWCNQEGVKKPFGNAYVKDAINDPDPLDALPDLVTVTCWPDDEAKGRMKEIDAARAKWNKKLEMSDADWTDVAIWAMAQQSSRSSHDFGVDYDKKYAWSKLTPLEQFAGMMRGFPNNGAGNRYSDYVYLADALGPKLSEAGRLGYIYQACLRNNSDATAVEWATCAPDLALLDRKKLGEELRADKSYTGFEKMIVRLRLYALTEKLKEMEPEWKKAKEKDPAYAKMWEISAATRKEWDQLWKSETALLDTLLAMDDARMTTSRKLKEGCKEKTWPAVKAQISKVPAKRFEGLSTKAGDSWIGPAIGTVATSPQGWLALAAYRLCIFEDKDEETLGKTISASLNFMPGYRGPRTATHTAIMNAGLQLDDASATISYPNADHRWRFGGDGHAPWGFFATVQKVNAKGDKVEIVFKPKLEKQEQCASSKRTNRIVQITSSGSLIYETICLKWQNVVVDTKPSNQTVDKRTAEGLKPGMNAIVSNGLVMAAFQKGKKVPSFVLGAAVK